VKTEIFKQNYFM